MRKKILSIFLVLCMVCTMLPVSATAEEMHTTMETLTNTGTDVIAGEESLQDTGSPDEESIQDTESPDEESLQDTGSPDEESVQGTGSSDEESLQDTGSPDEDMEATEEAYSLELAANSSAATSYGVWVGGVEVTSDNMNSVTGSAITGTVIYNPSSSTLTLDGAKITGACDIDGNRYGIYSTGNLNINLTDLNNEDSLVDGRSLNNQVGDSAGIYVTGNLTISGSGDLDVYSGEASNGSSYGIRVGNNLTLKTSVSADGGTARDASHGLSLPAENAILTVNHQWAWVNARGGTSAESYGIFLEGDGAKLNIIDNNHMWARGSYATNMSCGIFLKGLNTTLTVNNSCSLSASGGKADTDSYGILTYGSIDIKGDGYTYVSADSNFANKKSCGIYTNDITINGNVSAEGKSATDLSYGIFTNDITINGGTVKAISDSEASESSESQAINKAPTFGDYKPTYYAGSNYNDLKNVDNYSGYQYVTIEPYKEYGIWVGKEQVTSNNRTSITGEGIEGHITYSSSFNYITLNGAKITEAYTDKEGNKYGIYANNRLELMRIGENDVTGIYANGHLTIEGTGRLEVTGGAPTGDHGDSYGIHVENGNLYVEGGELIAAGAPVTGNASFSYGICINNGDMSISNNGSVTAIGAKSDRASYGVYLGGDDASLNVGSGSSLKATGGETDEVSYGIHFAKENSELTVSGSVTAMGGSSVDESCGILAGTVIVNGSATLEASGGSATDGSFGIISNNIKINGGKVEADSGVAERSQAMSSAPAFGSSYGHQNNAGTNGGDARPVTDEELAAGIDNYKYVEIVPVTKYDVWVGDVRVTSENMDNITCECITGIVTYDPGENTLTLNNVSITDTAYIDDGNKYGIYAMGDLNLVRIGNSNIVIPSPDADKNGAGIYVSGNLTISGDGSLVVTGGQITEGDYGDSYGIHIEDGDLTVKGGELIAAGAVAGRFSSSYGICVHDGNLTIKDEGSVIASVEDRNPLSYGVYLGGENASLTVESGSSLRATGASGTTAGFSYGIYFEGLSTQLTVNGGSVTAIGGSAYGGSSYGTSCGILVETVTVNGSATLEASGGYAASNSYGISSNHIAINGGTVEVASGEADISKAMFSAPTFGSGYTHQNNAGTNGSDAIVVTDEELTSGIDGYRYVQIEPVTSYDVWVGGQRVTSENKDGIKGEGITGIVTYDPGENILTLNNAMISEAYTDTKGNKYGIYAIGELKLERLGEHNSIFVQGPLVGNDGAGIYVSGNLTIFGDSKLVVGGGSVTEGDHGDSYGIHIENGDLMVEGGELIAAGAPVAGSSSGSFGICIHDGNLTMKGDGSVTAEGAESDRASYGVYLGGDDASLTVNSGSSLTATGGKTGEVSYGIHFANESSNLEVYGSVTAIGGSAVDESCGILTGKVIINDGATLEASGGSATDGSFGISSNNIIINGGKVEVDSGEAGISKAMSSAPTFDSRYSHRNNAGNNGGDASYVTDEVLAKNINDYKYIEITPYTPTGGDGGGSDTPAPTPGGSSSDNESSVTVTPTPPAPDKPNSPTQGEIKLSGKVDKSGNITVDVTVKKVTEAFDKALADAKKNGNEENGITVVLQVDTGNMTGTNITINLPKKVQDAIIAKKILNFVVETPNIRIDMDLATIQEINKQADSDVSITATLMDNGKLTNNAKKAIGSRPVFDLKVNYGKGKQIQSFGTGSISITIPYTLGTKERAGNIQAVYVDGKGKVHWLINSVYDSVNKVLRFRTNHLSTYGIGYKQINTAFNDIESHWAKEDIQFVVSRGLISSTSPARFSPNTAMTREMFAGYFEWASKNTIINDTDNGEILPDQPITREEMAVILQNYAKVSGITLPKVYEENNFADSDKISDYAKEAVKQMQMAGVISSKAGNLFDPQGIVTRAEASAVLRRFLELTISSGTMQGWRMNDSGMWMYYENGKFVTETKNIDGVKYFFNTDGSLKTGWVKDNTGNMRYYSGNQMVVGFWDMGEKSDSKTYYFDTNGNMVSGQWFQIDDKWYYFNADGSLARNTKIDEFEVDDKGVRKTK